MHETRQGQARPSVRLAPLRPSVLQIEYRQQQHEDTELEVSGPAARHDGDIDRLTNCTIYSTQVFFHVSLIENDQPRQDDDIF